MQTIILDTPKSDNLFQLRSPYTRLSLIKMYIFPTYSLIKMYISLAYSLIKVYFCIAKN